MAVAVEAVRARRAPVRRRRRIYDAQVAGHRGRRRRLPGRRADAARPASAPRRRTSPGATRRSVAGEATILELAACHGRYHCPMARTVFLGEPPRTLADAARGRRGGARDGAGGGRAGRDLRGGRGGVAGGHRRAMGSRKASRIGYSVGPRLPARLGRAHDEPAPRRHDAARAGHDLPHDPRHVDGRLGLRALGDVPRDSRPAPNASARSPANSSSRREPPRRRAARGALATEPYERAAVNAS